jgi:hypothetical protein
VGRILTPPVLSGAFRTMNPKGEVARSGYFVRIYLPAKDGSGIGEPTTGFTGDLLDANLSEVTWCAYAWPVNYSQSGNRTFFVNQNGDVTATETPAYSGAGRGPTPGAAFAPESAGKITGRTAVGAGVDGNVWKIVN